MDLPLFLVIYDRPAGQLVRVTEFPAEAREEAQAARLAAQLEAGREHQAREVVLIEAASLEVVKQTHGSYFLGIDDLAKRFETAGRPAA